MGYQDVKLAQKSDRGKFIHRLLQDIESLQRMVDEARFESDCIRIGAEQEFCLVNSDWTPSRKALDILEAINDDHFTTELGLFNLEANLKPLELNGTCFSSLENTLHDLLKTASAAADDHDNNVLLAGILPSIQKRHLAQEYMTPLPRYEALNDAIRKMRGKDFELHLNGVEELAITHDTVLFEACNTSFQMHLQIPPEDFVQSYNWAQTIAGPLLAIAANSPLLLGKELWNETRIALFQQSIDTRSTMSYLNEREPRVTFGNNWISSITDIYKDDIARYKILLSADIDEDSEKVLDAGGVPKLKALSLHNGTIYRWNRPCYGQTNGKPHIRIENRYIPSGPSVTDEVANFAFWAGLMCGRPAIYDDMPTQMSFKDIKANFVNAARCGGAVRMHWMGQEISMTKLICSELLPIARDGLRRMSVSEKDITIYLDVIRQRCLRHTGARWMVTNYRKLLTTEKTEDALTNLTRAMHENQLSGKPVAHWPEVTPTTSGTERYVHHHMTTHLFTAHEYDLARMVNKVMQWKNIHHMPVENASGEFVGLISSSQIDLLAERLVQEPFLTAGEIMESDLVTVEAETQIDRAIELMRKFSISSLPVVRANRLIGILTINDFKSAAYGHSAEFERQG